MVGVTDITAVIFMGGFLVSWMAGGGQPSMVASRQFPPTASVLSLELASALAENTLRSSSLTLHDAHDTRQIDAVLDDSVADVLALVAPNGNGNASEND